MSINIKFKPLQAQFEYEKLVEETKLHKGWKIPSSQEIKRLKPAKEHNEVWVSDTPNPNNNEDGTRAVIYNFKEKRTFEVHKICLMNVLILEEEVKEEVGPTVQKFKNLVKRVGYMEDEVEKLRDEVFILKTLIEKDTTQKEPSVETNTEEFYINEVSAQSEYDEDGAPILTTIEPDSTYIDYEDASQHFHGKLNNPEYIKNIVDMYRKAYIHKVIAEKLNMNNRTCSGHIVKLKKAGVITAEDIAYRKSIENIMGRN